MDTFPAGAPYGRSIRVNDNAVHIRRTPASSPDAEPAVYVHGHGGSSTNWSDLADLLSLRLDGIAVDLPGFGRSEPARSYVRRMRCTAATISARLWRRTGMSCSGQLTVPSLA
jgi:pimeloyl-ACP methyl ester carboxylesterase